MCRSEVMIHPSPSGQLIHIWPVLVDPQSAEPITAGSLQRISQVC